MTNNKNHKKATETIKKVKEEKNKTEVKSKKKTIRNTVQNPTESKYTELKEKPKIEKTNQVIVTAGKNELSEVNVSGKSSNLENQKGVSNVELQDVPSKIEDTNPTTSVKQETHKIDKVQQTPQISNGKVDSSNTNKQNASNTKVNNYKVEQKELSLEAKYAIVASKLTSSDYEYFFRKHARNISGTNERIKINSKEIALGSLSMDKNNGTWIRFSTNEGGNIVGFIQNAFNCSKDEALEIIAAEARIELVNNYPKPKVQSKVQPQVEKEKNPADEWKAIEPIPESAPKVDRNTHLAFLLKYNTLDDNGIYTYKNTKNQLLGYTLRLINKQNREKTVRPFTYCYNETQKKEDWRLKGFTDKGYKPIFGIEKTVNDDKPILIVEGEKSCREAQKLLPEYTVISWLGGSMTAGKAQWEQLAGKEVIIFPDNDESGMKAAYTISRIVNAANGYKKNVTIIDPKALEFGGKVHNNILLEKWDLADKLPEGVNLDNIREAIINKRIQNLVRLSPKNVLVESNKFSNIEGEQVQNIADRMLWQNNLTGHSSPSGEIKKNAIIEHGWQQKLSSSDAVSYMKYIEPGGTSRSMHEFLEYDHSFYQSILVSIAVNSELSDRKDLKLSDQISELQYSYSDKVKAFAGFYSVNETYLKYNKELEKTYLNSNEKTLLYKSLVRDFTILHQEQLGVKARELPVSYHELMAKEIYQNISSYKANNGRGQSTDKLENVDKANITTKLYKTLGNNEMWKKLSMDLMPKDQSLSIQTEYLKDKNTTVIQKQSSLNNSEIIKIVKQGMDDLRRHGTPTDINNAFVKYSTHGIEAGNDFVRHACQSNIEKKITDDLQIMENKYSGALTKEKELITVKDFKGVSYTNDDEYLKGIKQDENAMRYITENSDLGKKIQNVVQRVLQCQASNDLER